MNSNQDNFKILSKVPDKTSTNTSIRQIEEKLKIDTPNKSKYSPVYPYEDVSNNDQKTLHKQNQSALNNPHIPVLKTNITNNKCFTTSLNVEKIKKQVEFRRMSTVQKITFSNPQLIAFMSENNFETQNLKMMRLSKQKKSKKSDMSDSSKKNKMKINVIKAEEDKDRDSESFDSDDQSDNEHEAEKIVLQNRMIKVKNKTIRKMNYISKKTDKYISQKIATSNLFKISDVTHSPMKDGKLGLSEVPELKKTYTTHDKKYDFKTEDLDKFLEENEEKEVSEKDNNDEECHKRTDKAEVKSPNKKKSSNSGLTNSEIISCDDSEEEGPIKNINNYNFNNLSPEENRSPVSTKKKDSGQEIASSNNILNTSLHEETFRNELEKESNKVIMQNLINQYYHDISENCIGNYEEYVVNSLTIISFLDKLIEKENSKPPKLSPEDQEKVEKFDRNKKVLFLDLDETLIHSDINSEYESSDAVISIKLDDDSSSNFNILIRPFTNEFLQFASEKFNLVLFTAGIKSYADPVVDYLDPENKYFALRLYRDSCLQFDNFFVKDLSILNSFGLMDKIILDNCLYSFAVNLKNGILIPSYYYDINDKELLNVADYLEDRLMQVTDVREVNESFFGFDTIKIFLFDKLCKEGVIKKMEGEDTIGGNKDTENNLPK